MEHLNANVHRAARTLALSGVTEHLNADVPERQR